MRVVKKERKRNCKRFTTNIMIQNVRCRVYFANTRENESSELVCEYFDTKHISKSEYTEYRKERYFIIFYRKKDMINLHIFYDYFDG